MLTLVLTLSLLLASPILALSLARRVVDFARTEALSQPLRVLDDEEREILGAVLDDGHNFGYLWELEGKDFESVELGDAWERIRTLYTSSGLRAPSSAFEVRKMSFPDASGALSEEEVELLTPYRNLELTHRGLVKKGRAIIESHEDRTQYIGAGRIEAGAEGEKRWVRRINEPSSARMNTARVLLTLGLVSASLMLPLTLSTALGVIAGYLCVLVLIVSCVVVTLVDYDTLMASPKFLGLSTLITLLLATLSLWSEGSFAPLLLMGFAFVLMVSFEVLNILYKVVRGQMGMGFGDTLMVPLALGVPAVLFSDGWVVLVGLMVACFGSILGWAILRVKDGSRVSKATPMPFGPYLALAWIIAVPLSHILSLTGVLV